MIISFTLKGLVIGFSVILIFGIIIGTLISHKIIKAIRKYRKNE